MIPYGNEDNFKKLAQHSHWRKILSNFFVCEFVYDGLGYRTAEHVFQGRKIAIADPNKAFLFVLESKSALFLLEGEISMKSMSEYLQTAKDRDDQEQLANQSQRNSLMYLQSVM